MSRKRKMMFKQVYKSGTYATDFTAIKDMLNEKETKVEMVDAGSYDDGMEFITIRLIVRPNEP